MHDEPYVQYGAKVVEPPPGARQEWRIFVDLAIAMRKPLFGVKGLNGFVKATRRAGAADPQARASSSARTGSTGWSSPPAESSTAAGSLGATLWPTRTAGARVRASSGISGRRCAPMTRRCTRRRQSSSPVRGNCSPSRVPHAPQSYPFQLANRRNRHSMNSWLNELPGLHPSGKRNEVVIHPDDAAALGSQRRRSGAGLLRRRRDRAGRIGQRPPAAGCRDRRSRLGLTDFRPSRAVPSRSRTA